MKKNWLTVCMIFIFLATAFFAQNAFGLMKKMEVSELTAQADLIVVGEVKKIESRLEPGGGIFTYVTITAGQFIKGAGTQEVTLRYPGGEVGRIGLLVSDTPEFELGERVKVFLKGKDIYDIVGLYQGKYTVVDGKVLKPAIPTFGYDGIHWPGSNPMGEPYLINPNCTDPEAGTTTDQITAISNGANTWNNEGKAKFFFTYGGTHTNTLPNDGGDGGFPNGSNEIMFVNDTNYWFFSQYPYVGAAVWSYYWPSTGELFECDMAFNNANPDYIWNGVEQPTTQELDIWNAATHEFGHFLQLNDLYSYPADAEKTMYGNILFGETKKQTLDPDDIAGIQFIYGKRYKCGDADNNETVNVGDVIYTINYLFKGGPAPVSMWAADADGTGDVKIGDVIYLINYLFKGGSVPRCT